MPKAVSVHFFFFSIFRAFLGYPAALPREGGSGWSSAFALLITFRVFMPLVLAPVNLYKRITGFDIHTSGAGIYTTGVTHTSIHFAFLQTLLLLNYSKIITFITAIQYAYYLFITLLQANKIRIFFSFFLLAFPAIAR